MSRPYFSSVLHVEGMDLVGKSTVTKQLAAVTGAEVRHNCLVPGNPVYAVADKLRRANEVTAEVLGPLYVSALMYDLDRLQPPTGRQVQDSTIVLRSIAFNEVFGARFVVRELLEQIPRHPRFGRTILLTATIDARKSRLDERRARTPQEVAPDDLMVETAPAILIEMERALMQYASRYFEAVIVDTSKLSREEVHSQVMSILNARPRWCKD
jgi:thymidylate kinase